MTTKTNKSFTKRIKQTRSGKLLVRAKGQNHYNAKESGQDQLKRKTTTELKLSNKDRGRFLQS
jgi:ribosomal protein L35